MNAKICSGVTFVTELVTKQIVQTVACKVGNAKRAKLDCGDPTVPTIVHKNVHVDVMRHLEYVLPKILRT